MISLQTRLKLRFLAYTLVCFVIGFLSGFSYRAMNHKCPTQKATQTENAAVESKKENKNNCSLRRKGVPSGR